MHGEHLIVLSWRKEFLARSPKLCSNCQSLHAAKDQEAQGDEPVEQTDLLVVNRRQPVDDALGVLVWSPKNTQQSLGFRFGGNVFYGFGSHDKMQLKFLIFGPANIPRFDLFFPYPYEAFEPGDRHLRFHHSTSGCRTLGHLNFRAI